MNRHRVPPKQLSQGLVNQGIKCRGTGCVAANHVLPFVTHEVSVLMSATAPESADADDACQQ
jgi:hypothetical protein